MRERSRNHAAETSEPSGTREDDRDATIPPGPSTVGEQALAAARARLAAHMQAQERNAVEADFSEFADVPLLEEVRQRLASRFEQLERQERSLRVGSRIRALRRLRPAFAILFVLLLAGSAAAAVTLSLRSAPLSGRLPAGGSPVPPGYAFSEAGKRYRIVLAPVLSAGSSGWRSFITFASRSKRSTAGGGSGYPTRAQPLWLGEGTNFPGMSPANGRVLEYVLTGPAVTAVRIGSLTVTTRSASALPLEDRIAVFTLPASIPPLSLPPQAPPLRAGRSGAGSKTLPGSPEVVPLGRNGRPIGGHTKSTARTAAARSWYRGPGRSLPPLARSGACQLGEHGLPGLKPVWGQVVSSIRPVRDATGELLLSCLQSTYRLGKWTLTAAVLLNAEHPEAAAPGPIPGAVPVKGAPATVQAGDPSPPGALTAKRVGNMWLVVAGGRDLSQRLEVLDALRISRLSLAR